MNFTTLVNLLPKNDELKGFHPAKIQTLIDEFNAWRNNNSVDDYLLQVHLQQSVNRLTIRVVSADEGRNLFYSYAQGD